tara:strand:- start:99 stop:596 length:498 start_codon:yes stop_codon:yes gene_type:complete
MWHGARHDLPLGAYLWLRWWRGGWQSVGSTVKHARCAHQESLFMPHIVAIPSTPDFAPRKDVAAPERLIEGTPSFQTWQLDTALAEAAKWGQIRTGVWEATPGTTISIKGDTFEFCHILSGRVEIIEDGGDTFPFGAGDSFVMKPGFVGKWKTIETVRKIYVIAS